MPSGTRIAPAERRGWLEQYEHGTRIDKIAHEAGRTQRTINEHLAQARRERQQQEVTAGLLTQAYQRHFAQLLELAETLGQAAPRVNPRGILGTAGLDTKMLYQGLQAHVPRSRLWRAIKTWEESSRELDRESQKRRSTIEVLVVEKTAVWPGILTEGFVGSLWNAVLMAAEGRSPDEMGYRVDSSGGFSQLHCGNFLLSDRVPTQEGLAEIQRQHQMLLQALMASEMLAPLDRLVSRWQGARDTIQEEVMVLRLRQILPGQCRLCPGGEAPSGIHSTRTRRSDE